MLCTKISLVLLFCSFSFEGAYSKPIILSTLKKGIHKTRCKLHQLGSKIIEHDHRFGDPCEAFEGDLHHTHVLGSQGSAEDQHQYLNGHSYGPERVEPEIGTHGQDNQHGSFAQGPQKNIGKVQVQQSGFSTEPNNQGFTEKTRKPVDNLNTIDQTSGLGDNNIEQGINSNSQHNIGGTGQGLTTSDNKKVTTLPTEQQRIHYEGTGSYSEENTKTLATSEISPTSMDIDIRIGSTLRYSKEGKTAKVYEPVPSGGGKNNIKAKCNNGKTATVDGCLEQL